MVAQRWLEEPISILESRAEVGAVQSKLLLRDDPRRLDGAGGLIDHHGCPGERGRLDGLCELDCGQYDNSREIFSFCAAAAIVRKGILEEIGMFDSSFFCYLEDVDLSWRMHLAGYKILLAPTSHVLHNRGATSGNMLELVFFHSFKNWISMLATNYSRSNLSRELPMAITAIIILSVKRALLNRDTIRFVAAFQAVLWILRNLRPLLRKRFIIQEKIRRVTDDEVRKLMFRKCLVIRLLSVYFGRGLGV
jgi:GT2 family glycosyltransferase